MTAPSPAPKKRNALPHGVTPLDQVKHLSGLDFMQGILEGRFAPPPITATLKFELVEVEHGRSARPRNYDMPDFSDLNSAPNGSRIGLTVGPLNR
jgi:hypothetical protein